MFAGFLLFLLTLHFQPAVATTEQQVNEEARGIDCALPPVQAGNWLRSSVLIADRLELECSRMGNPKKKDPPVQPDSKCTKRGKAKT